MIDSKQAFRFALQHLVELLGDRELAAVDGIQLEELEKSDDDKYWNITLSYPIKRTQDEETADKVPESIAKFIKDTTKRKLKTLKIDSERGGLVSIKAPES